MVVKKGGGRERFDRTKLLSGLLKACEKRPVSLSQLERIVDQVELQVQEHPEHELGTEVVGKYLLSELRRLDKGCLSAFCVGLPRVRGRDRIHDRDQRVVRKKILIPSGPHCR